MWQGLSLKYDSQFQAIRLEELLEDSRLFLGSGEPSPGADVAGWSRTTRNLQRASTFPQPTKRLLRRTLRRRLRRLDLSQRKQAAVQRWAQRRFTPQWRTFRVSFSMMRFCFRSSRRICSTSPCVSRFLRCDCRAHDSVITVCVRVCLCTRARAARRECV